MKRLVLIALFFVVACGPVSVKQQIHKADRVAFEALRTFQVVETAAYHARAPWPTDAQHQQIGGKLSQAYTLVIDVANAGIALRPGMPLPAQLVAEIAQLTALVADVVALSTGAPLETRTLATGAQQKTATLMQTIVIGGK